MAVETVQVTKYICDQDGTELTLEGAPVLNGTPDGWTSVHTGWTNIIYVEGEPEPVRQWVHTTTLLCENCGANFRSMSAAMLREGKKK